MQRWIVPAAVLGGVALGVTGFVVAGRAGGVRTAAAADQTPSAPTLLAQTGPAPTTGPAQGAANGSPTQTITVDASGSVTSRPDIATLSLGVQVDRPTAQAA